jgi:hypothetical protein
MTQQLAIDRVHPRRRFLAAVAELVRNTSDRRPREATTVAPFDQELHLSPPFALLTIGPR